MKIPLSIEPTRGKRKENTAHYVYDIKHKEQETAHYVHRDDLIKQESVHHVRNIEHTEHNALNTIFLRLYNNDRFFK